MKHISTKDSFLLRRINNQATLFLFRPSKTEERLLELAGLIPELTPHSLRHMHTSLLAEAKVGLEEIMDRLGHCDDETTKNVYLHGTKEMKKEASQKFKELMENL